MATTLEQAQAVEDGIRTRGTASVRVLPDGDVFDIAIAEAERAARAPAAKPSIEITGEMAGRMVAALKLPASRALAVKKYLLELVEKDQRPSSPLRPRDYCDMLSEHPDLRPQLIHGICRVGEIVNVIAAPKLGKSYLGVYVAWCIATGREWLGFPTEQGRVLIIDNELHEETLVDRIDRVASALMIDTHNRENLIDAVALRGSELVDLDQLASLVYSIEPGTYSAIFLDAFYRTLPDGTSENDNAQMTRLYNTLDRYADHLRSTIFVIHHTSKGEQGGKGVTDVGSGAGAISRAADSHLTIRPHTQDGHAVLEAVTRSFKSPESISIRFAYPLWEATTLAPEVRRVAGKSDQSQKDREADQEVLEAIEGASEHLSNYDLRKKTGFGESRVTRSVRRLMKAERIDCKVSEKDGKTVERYFAT